MSRGEGVSQISDVGITDPHRHKHRVALTFRYTSASRSSAEELPLAEGSVRNGTDSKSSKDETNGFKRLLLDLTLGETIHPQL